MLFGLSPFIYAYQVEINALRQGRSGAKNWYQTFSLSTASNSPSPFKKLFDNLLISAPLFLRYPPAFRTVQTTAPYAVDYQ